MGQYQVNHIHYTYDRIYTHYWITKILKRKKGTKSSFEEIKVENF